MTIPTLIPGYISYYQVEMNGHMYYGSLSMMEEIAAGRFIPDHRPPAFADHPNTCPPDYVPEYEPDLIITESGYGLYPDGTVLAAPKYMLWEIKLGIEPEMGCYHRPE